VGLAIVATRPCRLLPADELTETCAMADSGV
jgi:hypothetical protein